MKTALPLAPFPAQRNSAGTASQPPAPDGFVDESVIAALVAEPARQRAAVNPADLALAADDMDFAGWNLPAFRGPALQEMPSEPLPPAAPVRRPAPPEPAVTAVVPAGGATSHRWWLAGLAGLISTLAVSAGLLALALNRDAVAGAFSSAVPAAPLRGEPPRPAGD